MTSAQDDPVRLRRAQMARLAVFGKRLGYGLFGASIIAFGIGALTQFNSVLIAVVVASIAVGSVFLAPAIVVGYGVRAADREDRPR